MTTVGPGVSRKPLNFLVFISIVIFVISILAAAGSFGWLAILKSKKESLKSDLEKNVKAFEVQTIEEYIRLDTRIDTARLLLANHIAFSNLLDYLNESTIKTVRYIDFKYDVNAEGVATITMTGQAKNYNSVAYQSEVFGKNKNLKSPIFSNLDLNDKGDVTFSFTTQLDPALLSYSRTIDKRTIVENPSMLETNATTTSVAPVLEVIGGEGVPAGFASATPPRINQTQREN